MGCLTSALHSRRDQVIVTPTNVQKELLPVQIEYCLKGKLQHQALFAALHASFELGIESEALLFFGCGLVLGSFLEEGLVGALIGDHKCLELKRHVATFELSLLNVLDEFPIHLHWK
jgi:hypothetical protein